MFGFRSPSRPTDASSALPGRAHEILPAGVTHAVFGTDLRDVPAGADVAYFALGCFWGAEKLFWSTPGVVNTAVGYQGGFTPHPTYEEVCSGMTGHAETVKVVFDPTQVSYADLVRVFLENHDPTQGMRQGNDVGSQYRSALFTTNAEQRATAEALIAEYQPALTAAGYGPITTEVEDAPPFFYAEAYHQQYLAKNPGGYCPIHATGVSCPVGVLRQDQYPSQTSVLPPE